MTELVEAEPVEADPVDPDEIVGLTGSDKTDEEAYKQVIDDVTGQVVEHVMNFFDGAKEYLLSGGEVAGRIEATVAAFTPMVEAGQRTVAELTNAHVSKVFGVKRPPPVGFDVLNRQGVTKAQEYARPFWTVVQQRRAGASDDEALIAGTRRMERMVDTDMQMTKVRQSSEVVKASGQSHYRRVSRHGSCPLCQIASTQTYSAKALMPIHPGCHCGVGTLPAGGQDAIDHRLDKAVLADADEQHKLIAKAIEDGTTPAGFRKLIVAREHGEIGPTLTWKHQAFQGPVDIVKARLPKIDLDLDQQVYDVVRKNGGITIDLEGSQPAKGYAYAPFKGTEVVVPMKDWTPEHVDRYIDEHYDELSNPGNHLGLWVEKGKVYTDISRVGPPSAATIATAQGADQLAVFDLGEFNQIDIGTISKKGVYTKSDEAANLHSRYREQVKRAAESASATSTSEVPGGSEARAGPNALERPATETRTAATAFDGTAAAGARLRKAHPGLSVRLDQSKMHPDVAAEATRALDDMLTKYPHSRLKLVTATDLHSRPNTFAQTASDIREGDSKIEFNESWFRTAEHVANLNTAYTADVAEGFHPPIGDRSPAYAVAVHEFAHTLDTTGSRRARDKVNETLADAYGKLKPRMTFNEWRAQQFSGYSFETGGLPDPPEMLAEAFADVEINGDKATDGAKALHALLIRESKLPLTKVTPEPPSRSVTALERKRAAEPEVDETPLPWTDADYAAVDNAALTAEQRALARAAADGKYRASAGIEPPITAAITATVEASGGQMYGLAHKLKEAPSLYRKAQDEMVQKGQTAQQAVDNMRDTVRYTAIVPEADSWKSGNDLRDALVSLGAEPVKQPKGISYTGYRGRNMTFKMHGTEFEVQIHTAKSMAVKDVNHKIFNVARASTTSPEMKAKLEAKMQRLWDTIPITKGTPVIRKEKDLDVWFVAKNNRLRGPTVPIIHDEKGGVHLPYGPGKGKHPPIEMMKNNTLDDDMAAWNRLTPDQQIEGIAWYPKLRWFLAENSRGTRFEGDIDRAAAMYAALSPRMDFDVNYAAVTKALRMTPEELAASTIKDFPGEFTANVDRLKRLAAGDNPVWEMRGNQIYSERQIATRKGKPDDPHKDPAGWHNGQYKPLDSPKIWNHTKNVLAQEDATAVTIDTWQARVALGIRLDSGEARRVLDGGKAKGSRAADAKQPEKNQIYEEFAEAVRQATAEANLNIHPDVLQALHAAGYTELVPYHLQAATWTASRQGAF